MKKPFGVVRRERVLGVRQKRQNAKQRSNYVDCACQIVELIGLVTSNERVSHKLEMLYGKRVSCSDADYPEY